MKIRKMITCGLAAAAVLAMSACAFNAFAEEAVTEEAPLEDEFVMLENDGLRLPVPLLLEDVVVTESPEADENGVLFSASELASIKAVEANGDSFDGAGWLFSIRKIDEARLDEMRTEDMFGDRPFAKDDNGNVYVLCLPTDVRMVRENYEYAEDELAEFSELVKWASETVPEMFIEENGLTPIEVGNTDLDMTLAKIAFDPETKYILSATQFGELEPNGADAAPFLEKLMNGVTFTPASDAEAPDGEYVVLRIPGTGVRFDFFSDDRENLVREVWEDLDAEALFRAQFADGTSSVTQIMQEWYDALAQANGKE